MTTKPIDIEFLTYQLEPTEANRNSLLTEVLKLTKSYLSVHPDLAICHDEIASDVAMTVNKAIDTLVIEKSFSAWLWLVISRRRIDYQRQLSRRQQAEGSFIERAQPPGYDFSTLTGISEENIEILRDINRGEKFDEAAELHGLTRVALDERLKRMKKKKAKVRNG